MIVPQSEKMAQHALYLRPQQLPHAVSTAMRSQQSKRGVASSARTPRRQRGSGLCHSALHGAGTLKQRVFFVQAAMASARTGHHRVQRVYFYYVNHLGNLYPLESAASLGGPLPFGPACVRGAPLDFVLSRIVPRPPDMETPPNLDPRFRWVSPCGRELNYVAAAATPIVFHTLEGTTLVSVPRGCLVGGDAGRPAVRTRAVHAV